MNCACGCGQSTLNNKTKKKRYIPGHQNRGNNHISNSYDKLIENLQGKILCQCGCGGKIEFKKYHFYRIKERGLPKFIHGHFTNTEERKEQTKRMNQSRTGILSPRWKLNRDDIRGRKRCKVDFTKRQKRDIYIRDEGICQHCKIICLLDVSINHPYKVNIDHIISVKDSGINEISNGQVLCLSCHKLKHSAKAKTANSVEPKAKAMAIPSQAPEMDECVETNVQSSKEMI